MTLNHDLVVKASTSLLKYAKKQQESEESTNLLADEEEAVHLIVSVRKLSTKMRHKPYRIPLHAPLYDESSSVCLITKNNDEAHVERLNNLKIPQIKEIVTMLQLRTDYKAYEARRLLISTHDLFLTDDRVVNSLPEALGVKFFKSKKLPAPVNLKASNLKEEMSRALSCTYFRPTKGTCNAIKIGMTSMSASDLAKNIEVATELVAKCIPKGWDNIQSIGIKTGTSLTLPIYSSLPSAPTAIGAPGTHIKTMPSTDTKAEDKEEEKSEPKKRKSKKTRSSPGELVKAFAKKRATVKA
ncbi:ribosomal protein L1 [Coemansia reversa NRRL 1564]|uniref:Ribosomal protein L1 n=1 Tax=Coemansia reversa (strain ATCC 12441 / NRRL 1564) TaxID=763665 RepID=A0A2G5BKY4_COERN|nr:ribosomal protein L1 [Coemansia reversa NRRL 1564]|eukprot:PIA19632.1 ribosomal protein L1 [Coemansia reversa NRRL 1564]